MKRMTLLIAALLIAVPLHGENEDRPNILWITSEDNGPHLGCYDDSYATSPNIDRLAKRSLRYTKASSTAPVCAPARTTIISSILSKWKRTEHTQP